MSLNVDNAASQSQEAVAKLIITKRLQSEPYCKHFGHAGSSAGDSVVTFRVKCGPPHNEARGDNGQNVSSRPVQEATSPRSSSSPSLPEAPLTGRLDQTCDRCPTHEGSQLCLEGGGHWPVISDSRSGTPREASCWEWLTKERARAGLHLGPLPGSAGSSNCD